MPGAKPEEMLQKANEQIAELKRQNEALRKIGRGDSGRGGSYSVPELAVLEELIRRIDRVYVNPDLVDHRALVIEGAKGMVRSLDQFSAFLAYVKDGNADPGDVFKTTYQNGTAAYRRLVDEMFMSAQV